jgi:sterol desaturase/sphingolipid hydroxylase (fatty acid hydroxylase superfamily)
MRWFDHVSLRPAWSSAGVLRALFSTTPPAWAFFLDFIVYPLLIMLCAGLALHGAERRAVPWLLGVMVLGYGVWTLAEYALHRSVLHHVPPFRENHLAHHKAPRELIGTPTLGSVAIFFFLVYGPLIAGLGLHMASALSVGLLAGYFSYVAAHYALHHWGSGGIAHLQKLKRHHALHHHRADDCNYGVTTTFWDRIFGTLK